MFLLSMFKKSGSYKYTYCVNALMHVYVCVLMFMETFECTYVYVAIFRQHCGVCEMCVCGEGSSSGLRISD